MTPRSAAYKLFVESNAGNDTLLPEGSSKKESNRETPQKIFPDHTRFLVSYFDDHPPSTLEMAKKQLLVSFKVSHFSYQDYGSI